MSFEKQEKAIYAFKGDYRWLSNFERCNIYYKGVLYKSAEAAYQAHKTADLKVRWIFAKLDARDSKALGRAIRIRPDWDDVKLEIMEEICRVKYNLPQFKPRLVATGDIQIVEGNYWGDTFWGVCNGSGENHLGKIIMRIRDEIKEDLRFNNI